MALYNAMGGVNWTDNARWASSRPLDEWYGVTTNPSGDIVLELRLGDNGLFGTLPPELGDLPSLQRLDLNDNQVQGEIPVELGNLADLQHLSLTRNQLRGEIPWELGNLTHLEVLALGGNRLEGEIPSELGDLANLRELNLSGNRLRGEIPPELGNLSALEKLHLQDNLLEGTIPPELGDLANLTELNLTGNAALNGCMPEGSAVPFCTTPQAFVFTRVGRTAELSWEPVDGASHYNIYYDDLWSCEENPQYCDLLDSVTENAYTHTEANDGYWGSQYGVAACNQDGCSAWATAEDGN
ncbi:MAG: leucine-rich repeat domain-containing protein [Gemmatimonadaceae bacterium]|nr:leucine-rich repeat domain-containing protein [Gemmatimonadaceae bacterium]